jgi:hypothetical protein
MALLFFHAELLITLELSLDNGSNANQNLYGQKNYTY